MYQLLPFTIKDSLVAEFPKVFSDLSIQANTYLKVSLKFEVQDSKSQVQYSIEQSGDFKKSILELRQHEIWKATCFEAFLKNPNSTEYLELNFNPAGAWNCYFFSDVRRPQPPQELASVVSVDYQYAYEKNMFGYDICLDLSKRPEFAQIATLAVGLTSILAMKDGSKKYMAISHTSDKPDFHKFDSFTLNKKVNRNEHV